jgi:hypothetical protein
MQSNSIKNLTALLDVTLDIQKLHGQERAVSDLKRYIDKTLHSIYKKPPKDMTVRHRRVIEDIQTLTSDESLKAYAAGLYANIFTLEQMASDYKGDAVFREAINGGLDSYDAGRLAGLAEKDFAELTESERKELGSIFAQEAVQAERMNTFIRRIQSDPDSIANIKAVFSRANERRLNRLLFDKKGNPKDVGEMTYRSKVWLVRRLTGQPEWSEGFEVREADASAREAAAERVQESELLYDDEKALLVLKDDGKAAFNPARLKEVEKLAAAVDRLKREGKEELADHEDARRERYRQAAAVLAGKVPNWMGGRPYSADKKFRGDWTAGTEYTQGDRVVFGDILYEAQEDTTADTSDTSAWKRVWAPNSEDRNAVHGSDKTCTFMDWNCNTSLSRANANFL